MKEEKEDQKPENHGHDEHHNDCQDCIIEFNFIQERILATLEAGGVGMNDHTCSVLLALAVWNLQALGQSEDAISKAIDWCFRVGRRRAAAIAARGN